MNKKWEKIPLAKLVALKVTKLNDSKQQNEPVIDILFCFQVKLKITGTMESQGRLIN